MKNIFECTVQKDQTINIDDLSTSYYNMPLFYNNYYFMARCNTNDDKMLWLRINEFISKVDAISLIGKTLYTYLYKPNMLNLTRLELPDLLVY